MTETGLIIVEKLHHGVVKLVLNNPPLNLVTLELTGKLKKILDQLDQDESVRIVVITGNGEKAFCAGADIKEFMDVRDQVVEKKLAKENEALSSIEFLSKPVIAAIEGMALGGGCEIALACDIRIMSEKAKIGLPEIKLGVFPGSGGLFRLPRLVGASRALELLYLGKIIDAGEAFNIGLVNQVVPEGEAEKTALNMAEKIAQQPIEAIKAIKMGVRESFLLSHKENVDLSLKLSDKVFQTEDCAEGVSAFFEKRSPQFKGVHQA